MSSQHDCKSTLDFERGEYRLRLRFLCDSALDLATLLGLRALRIDVETLLARVGIDPSIVSDADMRLPAEQGIALVAGAVAMSRDDNLGLHLSQQYEPGAFGTLDHLAHSASSLREAIELLSRYEHLHQNGMRTQLSVAEGRATISHVMIHPYPVPRQVSENTVANLLVIGRRLTGIDFDPLAVSFAHDAPADAAEHARFFRCPIRWGAPQDTLVIASALLESPLRNANPRLAAVLARHATELLSRSASEGGFVQRVREAICAELPRGNASLVRIAAVLDTSARTLQRRLQEQGTHLEALMDELRRELAREYLVQPRLGTTDVALMLGFSDDRAFRRAFRRWTGMSPAEFRRQAASLRAQTKSRA